jgi:hypothetical protein
MIAMARFAGRVRAFICGGLKGSKALPIERGKKLGCVSGWSHTEQALFCVSKFKSANLKTASTRAH